LHIKKGDYESAQTESSILAEYGHNVSYQWLLQIDLLGHGKPMDQVLPYKRDKHKKLRKIE